MINILMVLKWSSIIIYVNSIIQIYKIYFIKIKIIYIKFYSSNIKIIENNKMSDLSSEQNEFYLILAKSKAEKEPTSTKIINLGKHFLSQIKKFNSESTFEKFNEIERDKGSQMYEEEIKKDIEFYKAKRLNLVQRLRHNEEDLDNKQGDESDYIMDIMKFESLTGHLNLIAENKDIYLESLNFKLKTLKQEYDS